MAGKTGGDLERIRAEFRRRASGLKQEVADFEHLPGFGKTMAAPGLAVKAFHLVVDFILHAVGEEPAGEGDQ